MKHVLILLSLFISTASLAKNNIENDVKGEIEAPNGDCVATLTPSDCMSSSSNILECYSVTWNGGSMYWFIYVKRAPYGVGDGYNVSYSEKGKSTLYSMDKAFATKKEAISYFVTTVIGSSCKYVFN